MRTSLALSCLLGIVAVNAARMPTKVRSLAEASSDRSVNTADYWDAGEKDTSIDDTFGNTFTYNTNGNFSYTDEDGISWYFNDNTEVWTGLNPAGDSWYYDAAGDMDYVNT